VFERTVGDHAAVYVMRADGTHQRRLAAGSNPVFSPNGKRIAFTTFTQEGTFGGQHGAIIVMNADGSQAHAVTPDPLPFGVGDPSDLALGQPSWGPKP
jgi:Tol biopolymer transport system component